MRSSSLIYKITCTVNGKIFVGQTRQGLKTRIGCYRRDARGRIEHNSAIMKAMRKHGFDAFVFETLETVPVPADLDAREIHWISTLKATDREVGYNIQRGGHYAAAYLGAMRKAIRCIETGEAFESMASAARAKGFSAAALTLHMRGDNATCNGCHWEWTGNPGATIYETSDSVKAQFKATGERQQRSLRGPRAAVQCVETQETFPSLTAAGTRYGVDKRAIYSAVERGIAAAGLHWTRLGPKRAHNRRGCKTRQVKALETGIVYPSLVEAAKAVGLSEGTSIWCAIHRNQLAGGCHWTYV